MDATGPAWDLMLALFDADADDAEISVGDLATRANVARTTTVRWLRQLQHHGLASTMADPHDKRLVRVSITAPGCEVMMTLLGQAGLSAE